ncbi:MobH family relaxase, partial [Cupriavidus sp. WS]|uniref:MobH family relaxase n=1 Tax=Cupriavidus sp. WS TaxID=1312922 RepID=UPI0005B768BA
HAYPGGMLDHGLEIVAYALKLRQSHLLPAGSTPEDQAAQSEAWTAAVAYAALLHDIGKLAVDLHVELADGSTWHPWHGPLHQPYRFRYRDDREYRLHSAATGLLYRQLLDAHLLDWLSGYPALWGPLLYVLAGQYEHAGMLGELVVQADRASVAQELGGDPARAMAAPKHALQRKLLDGLRYLLKEELKLNQPEASDGWLTEDALWLVSKTVSDKLRAHLLSQGIDGIPANNTAVFNVLQDHGILQATPEGKAIWRATITGDNGWSNTFTFLRLAPALIWEPTERPAAFSGIVRVEIDGAVSASEKPRDEPITNKSVTVPAAAMASPASKATEQMIPVDVPAAADSVETLFGILDDVISAPSSAVTRNDHADVSMSESLHEIDRPPIDPVPTIIARPNVSVATPAAVPGSGIHFMDWLKRGVQAHKLIINDAKAQVHTVAGTAYLVSPGIFQRYVQEHPQVISLAKQRREADWQWVQKQFEQLRLHRKHPDGLNIWTCDVIGQRKTRKLHGYLMLDASTVFDTVPPDNPYLSVTDK